MKRIAFVVAVVSAVALGACRVPEGEEPEPSPSEDAGIEDAGQPPVDAGPPEDAGEPCLPPPDAPPSNAESVADFDSRGLTAKFNACASCHTNGSPTSNGGGWGAAGDTTPSGWHDAVWASIEADGNVAFTDTQVYDSIAADHPGSNEADPTTAQALVDWYTYATTPVPQPDPCNEPEPTPDPPPEPEPDDAGEVDAGEPEPPPPDAGGGVVYNGEAGVPFHVRFANPPQTVPRLTCSSSLLRVELVDGTGVVIDNPGDQTIFVNLSISPSAGGSFWSDTQCQTDMIIRVGIDPGENDVTFRFKADNAGEADIELIPVGDDNLLGDQQTQVVTP